jgi:hypothetical protein
MDMSSRKSCRIAVVTATLGMLGTGFVYAQSADDPMRDCEGLYDAFNNYSTTLDDPDKDEAKAMADEGLNRCKNDKHEEGIWQISKAIGIMHDGKPSKK